MVTSAEVSDSPVLLENYSEPASNRSLFPADDGTSIVGLHGLCTVDNHRAPRA